MSSVHDQCEVGRDLVIIPAHNEQATVGQVVRRVPEHLAGAGIIVVDDGSTDATGRVAREAGSCVLSLPVNLGMGGAMQTGYLYAAKRGYDVAIQIDGDGQHDPSQAGALIDVVRSGRADMAIGSRYLAQRRKGSSFLRRLGNAFLARYLSLVTRSRITDPTSGFRAVNRRVIEFYACEYPTDYPEPEAIAVLWRNGFRVVEVPVTMRERQGGRSSIDALRACYYMIKVPLAIAVGLLRRREIDRE